MGEFSEQKQQKINLYNAKLAVFYAKKKGAVLMRFKLHTWVYEWTGTENMLTTITKDTKLIITIEGFILKLFKLFNYIIYFRTLKSL